MPEGEEEKQGTGCGRILFAIDWTSQVMFLKENLHLDNRRSSKLLLYLAVPGYIILCTRLGTRGRGDDIILYYTINYITLHIIPTAGS